jgi:hypothetical protein
MSSILQQTAAAYKWGVANSSLNCFHWRWEEALTEQRAYALLSQAKWVKQRHTQAKWVKQRQAAHQAKWVMGRMEDESTLECSIWDALYNQVHVAYNLSLVRAIFYVNDTVTPRRLPRFNHTPGDLTNVSRCHAISPSPLRCRKAWHRLKQRLHEAALRAAVAALAVARAAQRLIAAEHNVTLPVVQYVYTVDCFRSERLATRLRLAKASGGVGLESRARGDAGWTARTVFRVPSQPGG